jgi:hypothetical protein
MDNYQLNLQACETAFSGASIAFTGGVATATPSLTAPGTTNNGSVDLRVILGTVPSSGQFQNYCNGVTQAGATSASRSYLKGYWNGTDDDSNANTNYDDDPIARAAFGVYSTTNRTIYFRENY